MINSRDSETPYIPPSNKSFKQQMDKWVKWMKDNNLTLNDFKLIYNIKLK
jgi:hypothetical protein